MTGVEVQELLRKEAVNAGGISEWATQRGVDQAAASRALKGATPPRPAILKALGLARKIEYVKIKEPK